VKRTTVSECAIVHAPLGRDATIAAGLLKEAQIASVVSESIDDVVKQLDGGAAFVVITEEALVHANLQPVANWISAQEPWSDLPVILLTTRGGGLERNLSARLFLDVLGNVAFIERPFHPTTFVSVARSALRARRRQYETRTHLERLRRKEEQYRTLFEAIESGFCIIEMKFDEAMRPIDYRLAEVNPAFERQTGLHGAQGRWVSEAVPGLEQHWYETYGRIALTGEAERFENFAGPFGRWYDVYAFRTGAPDEKRVAILFNDVTERRRATDELREVNATLENRVAARTAERHLLASIVDSTNGEIQAVGLDFRWLAINAAASDAYARIYGFRPKVGDHLLDLFKGNDAERIAAEQVWSRALAGEAFITTAEWGDPEIERRVFEMRFETLRDSKGERIGAFLTSRDITDRIEEQLRLENAEEQIRQMQKMEALGQLTGGVAHDFNNMLTIIRSSSEFLRRAELSEERRLRFADAITVTVDRAAKLTGQLLAFARRQALDPTVFDARDRVLSMTDMLATVMGSRIEIVTHFSNQACLVEVDVSQFETAIVNMAINARDAMAGEGRLTVVVDSKARRGSGQKQTGKQESLVTISMTDTGTGIEAEKLQKIFEPFYTTKDVGKGTGLGLSQVYGFAMQSGGEVTVRSDFGHGATFMLTLPKVDKPAQLGSAPISNNEADMVAVGRGRRVLVVEDNTDVGQFSTQVLEDLGYRTVWAKDGHEALKLLAKEHDFDAVFSDVMMPGISGIELGHQIRRLYPHLPVILTSGYSEVLAEEGRDGFDLVQKPYAPNELSRILHNAILKQEKRHAPVLAT
jgi:signal transduction histidine kinase/DNA-binding response OmpR family regulator